MPIDQEQPKADKEEIRYYSPVTDLIFAGKSAGYECYLIPCPSGLRPDSYDPVRLFLESLVVYFTQTFGCAHESFLQIGQRRDKEATQLFSESARFWIPEMGLGVWPNRPAPRMLRKEDMEDVDPTKPIPPIVHILYRVTAPGNARLNAMRTMTGTWSGVQILTRLESGRLLRTLKRLFLEEIEDRVFRIFPWYVPLLDMAALTAPLTQLTIDSMQGIPLYIRESPGDEGILIISAEPLQQVWVQLGLQQVEAGLLPKWKLSMPEA